MPCSICVPYSIAMNLNDATWQGHGCAIVVMSYPLLHWYNLYINEGHCWTYNTFVSGEEGHHQICMLLTTQHMNTLIAWHICTYTYTPTHVYTKDTAMNTYTDSVDQLCLGNSYTLKGLFSGLPQVFYCLFEKGTQMMLSQTLFS